MFQTCSIIFERRLPLLSFQNTRSHITDNYLPSFLRLFELTVEGNTLFRVATCVPIAVRLFHALCRRAMNMFVQQNSAVNRFYINVNFGFAVVEMISCALISIMTIRFDFPGALLSWFLPRCFHVSKTSFMGIVVFENFDDRPVEVLNSQQSINPVQSILY